MITHKGTQTINTTRLTLRRYEVADASDIFKNYATDKRVTRFLSWPPYNNIIEVEEFINEQVADYENDYIYNWVVEYNSQVVGSISAINRDEHNQSCEIGYCIGYDFWNQGITSEALSAVIDYLFTEIGYHRIFAKHDVENPASGKVMEKCNMIYEGRLRGHYLQHDGVYSDSLVYGILRDNLS